ncbi:hypothetical protein ACFQ1S_24320 [Kibdelosporangium lantanae]|uniref:GH18 domain-containing protein n=1 Tax=Kibdelosporangium lantanae TaxID=1497396 RepID=A0ABW3MEE8_9PSEU
MASPAIKAVVSAAVGLTSLFTVPAAQAAPMAPAAFPAHYAAPYLELSNDTVGDMAADQKATGLNHYTLAFLIPKSGCTPQWENGNYALGSFKSQIASLQSSGGDVIISFGGAEGGELALTCTNQDNLQAAYANVVRTYNVHQLDFDIEGGPLNNKASVTRRNKALAALQKADPSVKVDFTLPVDPGGLPSTSQVRPASGLPCRGSLR